MNDWTSEAVPDLLRITCVTVAVPDLAVAEDAYRGLLKLEVAERGTVTADLAKAWGAPKSEDAAYVLLLPQNEDDVYFRLVETPHPEGYQPLTTYGWNAFEIIVDDVPALCERLEGSGFTLIGKPLPLNFMPSIVAMQVVGPASECLYFTMESGNRETSILPPPKGFVGRTFIVVVAGPSFPDMHRWWIEQFNLRERPVRQSKVHVLQQAQALDSEHTIELSAIGMRERGNLVEIDGYPNGARPEGGEYVAAPRPRVEGHLPPGNAIVTLEVENAAGWTDIATNDVQRFSSRLYGERDCVMIEGPAGEMIELVSAAR